ncbi:MAG: hypothetical protein IPK78_16630 [Rhodospirillales bacterium]|nr:hypothetical protein [Rhodospirillales bacterium]
MSEAICYVEAFKVDIPPEIAAILDGAAAPYSEPRQAEQALSAALQRAPDNLGLRIAAYAFYFYKNRLWEAIPHAEACLASAAAALALPQDWRMVSSESARFSELEQPQRVYLKSLVALGYCRARLGDFEGGEALLRKAASLDPQDLLGAAALATLVARRNGEDDDEE